MDAWIHVSSRTSLSVSAVIQLLDCYQVNNAQHTQRYPFVYT